MRIVLTKHIKEKLQQKEAKNLEITKREIHKVLEKPDVTDKSIFPHRKIGKLNERISLCVIYRVENNAIIAITFYPAKKGRYESKIL